MSDESLYLAASRPLSSSHRRYLLFLVIFGFFALFFALGGRSLENKDSVRFAEISREILEFNDWIVLRLDGKIYPDKPALHFWITAGLYKLLGISPFTARLPEALAAFFGLFIAYFFSKKIFRSSETAFLTAIVLLSAYGYFFWARRTRIDIELAVFFSLSLVFFYCGLETNNRGHKILWYTGFWLATGCAIMSKGVVAFTNLAVVISYCMMLVFKGEGRKVAPGFLGMSSPAILLPILPWALPLLKHHEFSNYLQVYNQTVIMHRDKPFFTYFYDFPVKLFPASPFFFLGVWGFFRFRQELEERRGLVFALMWVGVYVFLLHFTSGKTARYLLPIYLPSALVAAWAILIYLEKYPKTFGRIMHWTDRVFFVSAVLSLVIPFFFAYFADVSLLAPLPYVTCLALAVLLTRKWLPLKAAGPFISFILLLLSIEVADGIHDAQTSDYLRLQRSITMQGLSPEQINFYPCSWDRRRQGAVSFYFNKLIGCSQNFNELAKDPTIKGIIATREAVEKEMSWEEIEKRYRIIPYDDEIFIILKF